MAQEKASCSGLDNLSRLPDELLLHIISLLPMKDSVRTSALSTRWRYLYVSRSNLEFYFRWTTAVIDVMNVIDRVFYYRSRCPSPINRFQICWGDRGAFDPLHLQGWINGVMLHGIREIDLHIPDNLLLLANMFTCETLVTLKLNLNFDSALQVPAKVFLPRLKVLELSNVIFFPNDAAAAERLLSNCPVLESFDYSFQDGDCKLIVFHPTLKHLSIKDDRCYDKGFGSFDIVINAPSLVYFKCFVFDVDSHSLINVQSLAKADIYFQFEYGDDEQYALAATDLMGGISNVHKLVISTGTLEDLLRFNIPIPMFHNLTHLELSYGFGEDSGFAEILYFLAFCESLQTLDLEDLPCVFNLDAWYTQEESRVNFLSFRLKTIDITSISGSDDQMAMVKYLLQNARVIEALKIGRDGIEYEEKLEISKMLLMLPRVSKTCSVYLLA